MGIATRTLSTAVGTVIGAVLLVGGLTGCTGGGPVTLTPVDSITTTEAPAVIPAGQSGANTSGRDGQGRENTPSDDTSGGSTPEEPFDPPVSTDPVDSHPGPSIPIDPDPGDGGPLIPIDPGMGNGEPGKPVVRDHRGPESDPANAPGGVVVTPSDPYAGAEVRDHRK